MLQFDVDIGEARANFMAKDEDGTKWVVLQSKSMVGSWQSSRLMMSETTKFAPLADRRSTVQP